jgi:hypothetical protein
MTAMRDRDLDKLLDLAARARPEPSPGLTDRVLADALAEQPRPGVPRAAHPVESGWLSRLADAFGGGPVFAGVASSVVLGLAVGYLEPATIDYLTGGLAGAEAEDLFPTAEFLTTEG